MVCSQIIMAQALHKFCFTTHGSKSSMLTWKIIAASSRQRKHKQHKAAMFRLQITCRSPNGDVHARYTTTLCPGKACAGLMWSQAMRPEIRPSRVETICLLLRTIVVLNNEQRMCVTMFATMYACPCQQDCPQGAAAIQSMGPIR